MAVVRPLPADVASRIAAGEVIERPASVLKELVENALDAGARKVSIEIKGAGRRLIRVTDDGTGLAPDDCRAAFERHTTSKIARLSDLEKLSTFGFRGEALFSIAAVARVVLTSCPPGSKSAWRVEIEGGRLLSEREAPPVDGTTIEVSDLFFNTPARAKFLKSASAERGRLTRVVEEAALSHPATAFHYKSEGRTVHRLEAHKDDDERVALRKRVREVLGDEYGERMLWAVREKDGLELRAFLSPEDALHSSRDLQFTFVNRRAVTSRTVQQALYRAYEPFRPKNRHPAVVLHMSIPSDRLDVNVHPTKREVRFDPERLVFETVAQTLSKALLEAKGIPTLGPSVSEPAQESRRPVPAQLPRGILEELGAHSTVRDRESSFPFPPSRPQEPGWFQESVRCLGQIERSYLVFEREGGILVVDQHAAQERVLFERYFSELQSGKPSVQKLMLPLPVELPASSVQRVLGQSERLKRAGFEVAPGGKTSLQVTAVPALFHKAEDVKEVVHSMLDGLLSPKASAADIRYDATATIACKAAVKAHDPLGPREAVELVEALLKCKDSSCCPHGRPTMLSLDRGELARRFKRSGAPPL